MPTATVITAPFAYKTRHEAIAGGLGDLPLIVVPHTSATGVPFGQFPAALVIRLAAMIIDEIEFSLTATAAAVASRYHERLEPVSVKTSRLEI